MINKKYLTLIFYIIYTLIFLNIFFKYSLKIKIICILIICSCPSLLRGIMIVFLGLIMILTNNYSIYKILSKIVYPNTKIDNSKQGIYISNYPSDVLEYLIPGLFTHKFCFVMSGRSKNVIKKILKEENVIYLNEKGNYSFLKKNIEEKIKQDYRIFVYPEKIIKENPYKPYNLKQFKTGIFNISKELNIEIFPLVFNHLDYEFGIIKNKELKIKILDSFFVNDQTDIDNCFKKMSVSLKRIKFK